MDPFQLYVAIYKPLPNTGNYEHWGLNLVAPGDTRDDNALIHVLQAHPTFTASMKTGASVGGRAFSPRTFIEELLLCEIPRGDVQQFHEIVRKAKVDNETLDWTCQDYIVEILEALEDERIIGFDGEGHDEYYAENKQSPMERYRAMI